MIDKTARKQLLATIRRIRRHNCAKPGCVVDQWAGDHRWTLWRERARITNNEDEFNVLVGWVTGVATGNPSETPPN